MFLFCITFFTNLYLFSLVFVFFLTNLSLFVTSFWVSFTSSWHFFTSLWLFYIFHFLSFFFSLLCHFLLVLFTSLWLFFIGLCVFFTSFSRFPQGWDVFSLICYYFHYLVNFCYFHSLVYAFSLLVFYS